MVIIRGQYSRAAKVLSTLAVLFAFGTCLSIFEMLKGPGSRESWPKDAALTYHAHVLTFWVLSPLVTVVMLLSTIGTAYAASRFFLGGTALEISKSSLRFPALPGLQSGRSVDWNDVGNISVFKPLSGTRCLRNACVRSVTFLFGGPLILQIDLKAQHAQACKSRLLRFLYWTDQVVLGRFLPKDSVLEWIHTGSLSHLQVVRAIHALAEDRALRDRYGGAGANYTVREPASGELCFELE